MRKTIVIYWIFTGLLAALMLMGSIPDVMSVPSAVELFQHLGYPAYLLPFLGIAKILGVIAIVVPGFPRLKEWAYAGFVFDLAGAMYSSIAVGDPASSWLMFPIGFILIAGSYVYANKKANLAVPTSRGIDLS
ncbi:DoxX family protein [Paenibacillus sp. GCM10023248]|uniref:DoxX family protein n=1 Tax=Bacillales TaxID=1385 RepID=UPI0023786081|nr:MULTISPECIES: DoxX family protein [Bacillales]MDD9271643.1 DoxX family protein [Paenibacillus sp. MAHUQ-63]MDR6883996.1 putative membrane protein YphA (DoxX/SURF4 family) [Bacillus sp. 3255]